MCRVELQACGKTKFQKEEVISKYRTHKTVSVINAAALLVDNGRAGTLSRLEEIIEFAKQMKYKRLGLAYCFGMESLAVSVMQILKANEFIVSAVSCSIGGIMQSEINTKSCIHKVACNPAGQAIQLNTENAELTIIMGICLGHDIILQKNLTMDFTTLLVKDRVNDHNPAKGIETEYEKITSKIKS